MANANNPNNTLGTPNEYSGITSREGWSAGLMQAFSAGIVSGFNVTQAEQLGMKVLVGGDAGTKDTLIAEATTGDKYVIFNKSDEAIEVSIPTAPTANKRIDSIVVYRDLAATSNADTTDNPACVGIIVVSGAVSANPVAATDAQIRAKLPHGSQAVYCVIATVTVAAKATTVTNSMIFKSGPHSYLNNNAVSDDIVNQIAANKSTIASLTSVRHWVGDFGYGKNCQLTRIGNIVQAVTYEGTGKPAMGVWTDVRIVCPLGYRPKYEGRIIGALPGANATVWCQRVPVGSSNMDMLVQGDANSSNDYQGTGTWITSDPMPD